MASRRETVPAENKENIWLLFSFLLTFCMLAYKPTSNTQKNGARKTKLTGAT